MTKEVSHAFLNNTYKRFVFYLVLYLAVVTRKNGCIGCMCKQFNSTCIYAYCLVAPEVIMRGAIEKIK